MSAPLPHPEVCEPPRVLDAYRARMAALHVPAAPGADPFDGTRAPRGTFTMRELPPPERGLIGGARVPSTSPLLPEHATRKELLTIFARAYKTALRVSSSRGKPFSYAAVRFIETSAAAMRKHDVPPLFWAVWSMCQWATMQEKATAESELTQFFVFSPKRVEKQRNWFASEFAPLSGAIVHGRYGRSVCARYTLIGPLVVRGVPLEEAVGLAFPEGYGVACARAKAESERVTAEMRRRVAAGDYIWTPSALESLRNV